MSGPGKTARAMQCRLKRWPGQLRRSLEFFTQIEEMHKLAIDQDIPNSAELALDAGYSDQSHMGRMLRKATGFHLYVWMNEFNPMKHFGAIVCSVSVSSIISRKAA